MVGIVAHFQVRGRGWGFTVAHYDKCSQSFWRSGGWGMKKRAGEGGCERWALGGEVIKIWCVCICVCVKGGNLTL